MQKFTIFTIIFSVIIVSIITELVVQDYLQKVYPTPESLQASASSDDSFKQFVKGEKPIVPKVEPEAVKPDKVIESKVEEILKASSQDLKPTETDVPTSPRVETLLPALDIPNVKFVEAQYTGKLFHLIDTTTFGITKTAYGVLQVGDQMIGSAYEYTAKNDTAALAVYEDIKTKADSFPEITINETGQFGQKSFFINHAVKVNEVFIVIVKDNFIYAFAYKKDFHDKFKAFFEILI